MMGWHSLALYVCSYNMRAYEQTGGFRPRAVGAESIRQCTRPGRFQRPGRRAEVVADLVPEDRPLHVNHRLEVDRAHQEVVSLEVV